MGCDIHLCVEKRRTKGWFRDFSPKPYSPEWEKILKQLNQNPEWLSCNISSERPWSQRHYGVFAKLADVRNFDNLEHLPLRGFPNDACFFTLCEYARRIVPDSEYDEDNYKTIPESRANEYIKKGYSKEITVQNVPRSWKDWKFVTDSDYHSPNWCTLKELEDAVKEIFYEEEVGDYVEFSEEWLALIGYMKGLEMAGFETRCVFWFDN